MTVLARVWICLLVTMVALSAGEIGSYPPRVDADAAGELPAAVVIAGVAPLGAAVTAGLQEGDVILTIDGVAIGDGRELRYVFEQRPLTAERVDLLVRRGQSVISIPVTEATDIASLGWRLQDLVPDGTALHAALLAAGVKAAELPRAIFLADLPAGCRRDLGSWCVAHPAIEAPPWLQAFVALYRNLLDGRYGEIDATTSLPPTPLLAGLVEFWRRLAGLLAVGRRDLTPELLGVDTAWFVFAFPHPHQEKPALGDLQSDPAFTALLTAVREDSRAEVVAREQWCRELVGVEDATQNILIRLRRALVLEKTFGSSLYLDRNLTHLGLRQQLRECLQRETVSRVDGVRLVALLLVQTADGDESAAVTTLGRLAGHSPYLAWRAYLMAFAVARHHLRRTSGILVALQAEAITRKLVDHVPLAPFYDDCARRNPELRILVTTRNYSLVDGIPRGFVDDPAAVHRALSPAWIEESVRRENDRRLADIWRTYAMARATQSSFLDTTEAAFARQRLWELLGRSAQAHHLEAMAVCDAFTGDFDGAIILLQRAVKVTTVGSPAALQAKITRYLAGKTGVVPIGPAFERSNATGMTWTEIDGKRYGPVTIRYPDGTLRCQGSFYDGKSAGRWRFFHPDGAVMSEGRMWADCRMDRWQNWYPSGQLKEEGLYSGRTADEKINQWQTWHPNGTLASRGSYDRGRQHGEWFEWHDNGTIARQATYERGFLRGVEIQWDRQGQALDASLPEKTGVDDF